MNKDFNIIDNYIKKTDESRNNANLVYSLPTLNSMLAGKVAKDFWLDRVYKEHEGVSARDLHDEGWLYLHNMSILGPYCAGFSAKDLATLGLNSNASNNIATRPPKYYRSLLDQCANFIAVVSQEIHGACAINDLTAIVGSYVWYQEEVLGKPVAYHDLVNAYESFIYAVNTPFRAGNSPFTNITMSFDWDVHIVEDNVVIGGEAIDTKYGDIDTKYLDMSNNAFIEAMAKGDAKGKPFTFPLITVNVYDKFNWENDTLNNLLENMDRWGGCYFENFQSKPFENEEFKKKNKFIEAKDPKAQRSFCCRFSLKLEDIMSSSGGSSFRNNSGVGGVSVFNINLNRIAYLSMESGTWDEKKFYDRLDFMLEAAQSFAQRRRKFIEDNKELYPYFFYYNKDLGTFFNVMSIVGGEEAIQNLGYEGGLKTEAGRDVAHGIATHIVEKINEIMKRDKVPVSLEYAPSENGAPTLAKKDVAFLESLKHEGKSVVFPNETFTNHGDIYVQGTGKDIYLTSGFQPSYSEKNIGAQIQISGEFQAYATGGSIQHFFLNEKMTNKMKRQLVEKTFEYPVNYMTLTPTITACQDCGEQQVGEEHACNSCGSNNVSVASRVIGYLRPIAGGNLTKEDGRLDGDENYWQDSRRADWACRTTISANELESLLID